MTVLRMKRDETKTMNNSLHARKYRTELLMCEGA